MIQRRPLTQEENEKVAEFILGDEVVNNESDLSYDVLHLIKKITGATLDESDTFVVKKYIELKVKELLIVKGK